MRYDDRDDITPRRDDDMPPRRPSGPDGGSRSGGASRPHPYGGDRPSRPRNPAERVGNTPSRPQGPGMPPSNVPSRPRPSGGAGGGPTPRLSMGQRGQSARDAMQRVRDAASSMYEVMNRELRSFGQRGGEGRHNSGRGGPPSSPQPRDYPSAFDGDERGFGAPPTPNGPPADARTFRAGGSRALTTTGTRAVGHPRHSLARRLRDRRAKLHGEKRRGGISKAGQAMLVVFLLVIVAGGGLLSGYSYFLYQKNAQAIQLLAINRDSQTTRIYDRNGTLLYQIYGDKSGRRDYITYCQIPPVVMHATVDTEDASFWSNPGFDAYHDIVAAYKNLSSQSIESGASTITEQLVKNAVLNDDRQNVGRKLDEAILAVSLTQQYSKQQILTMYLNEVSYGPLDYGIEAAAENYFGLSPTTISLDDYRNNKLPANRPDEKAFVDHLYATDGCHPPANQTSVIESGAWQLQNWQAELLAGVPQNPNNQSPYLHPQASVLRMRDGVLPNMINNGDGGDLTISGQPTPTDNASKIANIVKTAWLTVCEYDPTPDQANYLPPCPNKSADPTNPNANRKIHDSVQVGNGTSSGELAPYFVDYVINQLEQSLPRDDFATQGWNIYTTLDYGDPQLTETQLKHVSINYAKGDLEWDVPADNPDVKGVSINAVGLQQYAEYITKRNITEPYPDDWYCGFGYSSPQVSTLSSPSAAGGNKPACTEAPLNEPASFVRYTAGQRQDGKDANDAALVAIDPRNGDILAMVGGIDYDQINYAQTSGKSGGENNLATSTKRSMGSSTKPIIYATAFQMGWNPGTIVRDEPTCFPYASPPANAQDPKNDEYLCPKNYLPHNYESANWAGAEPLTMELGNSLNTPATMAMSFDGIYPTSPVLSMAQRLGVTTLDPSQLGPSTALGSQPIPLYQLTSAYGTFANNGVRMPERAILQITDPFGNQVKDTAGNPFYPYVAHPTGYQALSPQTAYEITSILTNNDARVGNFGHVNPLYFPGRDVAAKTGTSQSIEDIVTMGYTPSLALGVWVGNADKNNTALTGDIIGIAGAAYIFNAVMAFAIDHYNMPGTPPSYGAKPQPGGSFPIPPNMQRVVLSCYTGLAPYQGQDATDSYGGGCNHAQEYVPPQMKGEMANGTWSCIGWGCNDTHDAINLPGIDTAWIPAGSNQIPTTP